MKNGFAGNAIARSGSSSSGADRDIYCAVCWPCVMCSGEISIREPGFGRALAEQLRAKTHHQPDDRRQKHRQDHILVAFAPQLGVVRPDCNVQVDPFVGELEPKALSAKARRCARIDASNQQKAASGKRPP